MDLFVLLVLGRSLSCAPFFFKHTIGLLGEVSKSMSEAEQLGVGLTRLAMVEAGLTFFVAGEANAIEMPLLLYEDRHDEHCPWR